jgi:hypothetical protein
MVDQKEYELNACEDCVMYIANGDVPDDDANGWTPEAVEAAWPSKTYHMCVGDGEGSFMWRGCDVCGSRLGGTKYPVVAWCDNTPP